MRLYRKWDERGRRYKPYEVPDSWRLLCYSADMDEPCDCAQCGKPMRFGDGYTSMQVQTEVGFGYMVCEACHAKELKERREARDGR